MGHPPSSRTRKIYNQRYSSLCVTSSPGLGRSVFLIVEQQIGNEGVGLALPTEGRRLAVAGHEGDVVAERPQPLADRAEQLLVIAARKIGAADRTPEQHVAAQQ